jgi:hypothetical protein
LETAYSTNEVGIFLARLKFHQSCGYSEWGAGNDPTEQEKPRRMTETPQWEGFKDLSRR